MRPLSAEHFLKSVKLLLSFLSVYNKPGGVRIAYPACVFVLGDGSNKAPLVARGERAVRCQWQKKHGERVAAVKISAA